MSDIKYNVLIDLNNKNTSHTKIINLINNYSSILEFGCSTGYMSKELLKKGCKITGVEINKTAAQLAKKYCDEIIIGDIETIDYKKELKDSKFDYIVFADVLEHLKNPKTVLIKIKQFLKKDGELILSVPNIAHASIRLELLTGDLEYEELGILDETHLKYFTKKSIVRLLESCGYYVNKIDAVSKGLSQQTIKKFLSKIHVTCNDDLLKLFNSPDALAYQYIIVSKTKRYSLKYKEAKPLKILNDTDTVIQQLQQKFLQSQNELNKIQNSRGWKILSFLHSIRLKIPIFKSI